MKNTCILLLIAITIVGCDSWSGKKKAVHKNGKAFYKSCTQLYGTFPLLEEEITEEDTLSLSRYYIGFYNEKGKLFRYEQYVDKKLLLRNDYTYHENGKLKERVSTGYDGKNYVEGGIYIVRYDSRGKRIHDSHEGPSE